ncbi:MAG: ribonuclease domain-containing protein [Usitatibacter sp.]
MRLARWLAAAALALSFVAPAAMAQRATPPAVGKIGTADLPREARATLALIRKAGPYPYAQDGIVFGNREAILPKQKRGYYREYTVKTPGERTRGARRIVSGAPGEYYYTQDHYNHFSRIVE